jgi:hypothetical protein
MTIGSHVATTKTEIAQAIVDRLVDQVAEFNRTTLFLSIAPDPDDLPSIQHNLFGTVAVSAGNFDEAVFVGGGQNTVFYNGSIAVTIFSKIQTGRPGVSTDLVSDRARGLWEIERKVLRALAGHAIQNPDGDPIGTEYLQPLSDSDARREDVTKTGDLQVVFALAFEWDLTT